MGTSVGEDVKKLEPSHTALENIKYCSSFGKIWHFLKMLNRVYYMIQQFHTRTGKYIFT
jgi:hypothetical protein